MLNLEFLSRPLYFFSEGRYTSFMIFPLEELIEYDGNLYEITAAASRRSFQLSMLREPEIEMLDGKVVSLAALQIFTKEVEFRIEE
jgi:DNA-directed RNA polymerase subunit omega